ncbi:hypothetical protein CRYUN_Cryun34aG0082000 [Craigia yunnanensis]
MEKIRGVSSVLMFCLVLGILVGQSRAQIIGTAVCYADCYVPCVLRPQMTVGSCAVDCFKNCILFKSTENTINDTQYFCNLGCAIALCSNFSTKENPAEQKVASCVDDRSETCAKN